MQKNAQKVTPFPKGWAEWFLKRKFSNLLSDSGSWSLDFKVEFFPLQLDIPDTLLCLTVLGVASISRMLVVLQKTNNSCEMPFTLEVPFLGGGIFDMKSALFVTLCQKVPEMLGGFTPILTRCTFAEHHLENMPTNKAIRRLCMKIKFSAISHKSVFWSAKKLFKKDSNDYIINNLPFRMTCTILHNWQNKFTDFTWKLYSLQFQITAGLNQHKKSRKIDLDYYVINHQWFSVA